LAILEEFLLFSLFSLIILIISLIADEIPLSRVNISNAVTVIYLSSVVVNWSINYCLISNIAIEFFDHRGANSSNKASINVDILTWYNEFLKCLFQNDNADLSDKIFSYDNS